MSIRGSLLSEINMASYSRYSFETLLWRHNGRDNVSNHQPHDGLLSRLFRRRSKKPSKIHVTGLCAGNSPGPVNSLHKWPVTRKMFPFDEVIMNLRFTSVVENTAWIGNHLPPFYMHVITCQYPKCKADLTVQVISCLGVKKFVISYKKCSRVFNSLSCLTEKTMIWWVRKSKDHQKWIYLSGNHYPWGPLTEINWD